MILNYLAIATCGTAFLLGLINHKDQPYWLNVLDLMIMPILIVIQFYFIFN